MSIENEKKQWLDSVGLYYRNEDGKLTSYFVYNTIAALHQIGIVPSDLGPSVLMIGLGGVGIMCNALQSAENVDLTVIEGSKKVIDEYIATGKNKANIIHTLFEDYSPNKLFDTIYGVNVLEHVDNPVAVMQKVKTWCCKGGRGIFIVPNADSLHRRIGVEMGLLTHREQLHESEKLGGHKRTYRVETLSLDLEKAGWYVQEVRGYTLKVLSQKQMKDFPREFHDASLRVSLGLVPECCSNLLAICRDI